VPVQVLAVVRGVLGAEVAAAQPLAEAGLDSLGAVELRGALGARFGAVLPATVAFDYSTPAALAEFLSGASDAPLRGPASGRALGPSHTAEPAALWMLASTKDAVSVCKLSEHAACLRLCMPLHSFVPCPAAYTRNISATGLSMSSLAPQAIAHGICLLACIVMDPSPGAGLALPQEQSSPSAAVPADACEPRSASASSSVGDERRHAHARAAPHPSRARRGSARRQRAPPGQPLAASGGPADREAVAEGVGAVLQGVLGFRPDADQVGILAHSHNLCAYGLLERQLTTALLVLCASWQSPGVDAVCMQFSTSVHLQLSDVCMLACCMPAQLPHHHEVIDLARSR